MKTYLLIHGSWHGAWCWHKVAPRLRHAGHKVIVPDLPGRAADQSAKMFISLNRMTAHVAAAMPKDQKTTIVVHSRYGVLASNLAQQMPDRIERVIYLASYMIPSGARAGDYFRQDKGSLIRPHVSINKRKLIDRLAPEIYRDGLYHDCSEDDIALASSLLCDEPLRPALKKLSLTSDRYGRVPKGYIRLTEDRAVTLALQDKCLNETPVDRVEDIHSSHSAYFSKPDELVEKILSINRA